MKTPGSIRCSNGQVTKGEREGGRRNPNTGDHVLFRKRETFSSNYGTNHCKKRKGGEKREKKGGENGNTQTQFNYYLPR